MSTETIFRCNFCGISDKDQPIVEVGFMGKKEDYHICGKCNNVVSNLLYEVANITIRNPRDTSYNGQEGLNTIITELTQSAVYNIR